VPRQNSSGGKERLGSISKMGDRYPPCLIGMEACSSAHQWARELNALGHTDMSGLLTRRM
jgi:transposase